MSTLAMNAFAAAPNNNNSKPHCPIGQHAVFGHVKT